LKVSTTEQALKLTQLMNSASLAHKEKRIDDITFEKILAHCRSELKEIFP
jgi:hypothetical protein